MTTTLWRAASSGIALFTLLGWGARQVIDAYHCVSAVSVMLPAPWQVSDNVLSTLSFRRLCFWLDNKYVGAYTDDLKAAVRGGKSLSKRRSGIICPSLGVGCRLHVRQLSLVLLRTHAILDAHSTACVLFRCQRRCLKKRTFFGSRRHVPRKT